MVMDVTPSPQCVGREFVRQYYTLLNEAPQFLHRFYSNNSSFIHGGEGKQDDDEPKPVIGQSDIHKKIMSLNFKDCHAKIRYVDSQSTIATGVVVQVTGELSNNQEPLRRFMQTFVLAPQSPNKYYVHNDIFRYQDEVFADSDEEDDLAEEEPLEQQVAGKQSPPPEPVSQPDVHMYHQQMMADRELHQQQVNGRVVVAETVMSNGHGQETVTPPPAVQPDEPVQRLATPEPTVTPVVSEPEASPEPVASRVEAHVSPQPPPASDEAESASELPKPRSWATIAHVSGGTIAPVAPPPVAVTQGAEQPAATMDKPTPATQRVNPMRNHRPGGPMSGDARALGDVAAVNKPSRGEDGTPGGDERRTERVKYPDSQQIFVGNLPNMISEFELRDFFRAYGPVLEVRINRNSPNKLHFGFVVFESETVAQKVLEFKSLDYKGHRVNIEEKKARSDRPHSNPRHGGRRDGPRHTRGSGGSRGGGFSGAPREDGDNRTDQGRYNNINKSNPNRR